jgi:hypothetical protein
VATPLYQWRWDRSGTETGPKWDRSWTEVGPKWDRSGTEVGPKWDRSGTEMGPKWDPSGTQEGPKLARWHPNWKQHCFGEVQTSFNVFGGAARTTGASDCSGHTWVHLGPTSVPFRSHFGPTWVQLWSTSCFVNLLSNWYTVLIQDHIETLHR